MRLLLESELQTALIGSPNQLAAVTAGVTRKLPEFATGLRQGSYHWGHGPNPLLSQRQDLERRAGCVVERSSAARGDGPPRPKDLTTRCRVLSPSDRMRYSPGSLVVIVSPSAELRDRFTERVFEEKGVVLSPQDALRKLIAGPCPTRSSRRAPRPSSPRPSEAPGGRRERRRRARRPGGGGARPVRPRRVRATPPAAPRPARGRARRRRGGGPRAPQRVCAPPSTPARSAPRAFRPRCASAAARSRS